MNTKIIGALCLLPALAIGSAEAAAILNSGSLTGSATTIDFSQFVENEQQGINGPIQLGTPTEDIQVSTQFDPLDLWLTNTSWGLAENGTWNSERNGFLGILTADSQDMNPIKISFNSENISGFGFFMNYLSDANTNDGTVSLSAYDSGATLLDSFVINAAGQSINTLGADNAGAFRGIQRDSADINYILLIGYRAVFDDLQFTRATSVPDPASVPEPASIALLLLGLAGAGYSTRKKTI